MSIGPAAPLGAAGTARAEAGATSNETARQRAADARRVEQQRAAAAAAGVAGPDGEHHDVADQGGDGRQPWQRMPDEQSDAPGELLDLTG